MVISNDTPQPRFYNRKGFWDQIEIVSALMGAISGTFTGLAGGNLKSAGVVLSIIFFLGIALAGLRSKRLGEQQEDDKARRDEQERQNRKEELDQLKSTYEAQAQRMLRKMLERMKARYFESEDPEEKHKHRITLFRCVEIDGPDGRSKHLAIFARGGGFQDSNCTWPLDDNNPERCRGIAGKIWFNWTTSIRKAADCDWPDDNTNAEQKAHYASSLGITVEEADALNVKSKVFAGAPIEVRGEKWGVLLLDSLKEGQILDNSHKRTLLNQYAKFLAAALEGIES